MENDRLLFDLGPQSLKVAERRFKEHNPIWTGCKAKLIERYLYYFVQITRHGTYLDGFSGPQKAHKLDMWSAKLVMESCPRWFRNFYLFELAPAQVKRIEAMVAEQPAPDKKKREPKRKVIIYPGDFNANIFKMLADHPIPDKQATFCLLDQRTFECDWASVKAVAEHKSGGNKIELFYFFPEGWINRSICARKNNKEEGMRRWWGNDDWPELLKRKGVQRAEYVSKRFRSELKYKHVYPFAIYEKKNGAGRVMYYMIHASDHDEATTLMWRAYGKALDIKETEEQLEFVNCSRQLTERCGSDSQENRATTLLPGPPQPA